MRRHFEESSKAIYSCCGSKFVKAMLFMMFMSTLVTVHSFQPISVREYFLPGDEECKRINRNIHLMHSKRQNPQDDAHQQGENHESWTRRELFSHSMSPALAFALSVLEVPSFAHAEEGIGRVDTSSLNSPLPMPFSSTRDMKVITLSNGLQVLMVNDKIASQSKAALVVDGAGQFTEYNDLPGLAHLMEHMVLSSNSNPNYNRKGDFEEWLGDNEGSSNAFTAYDNVSFDVLEG